MTTTTIPVVGGREAVLTAGASESGYRNALGFRVVDAGSGLGPDVFRRVFDDDGAVAPGTRFPLGAFREGSAIEFSILQDGGALLTGDEQARVSPAAGGGFAVGFEDLLPDASRNPGGFARDDDFDDLVFVLRFEAAEAPVPGPARAVFSAFEPATGIEAWVTDGTAEGTRLLLDINRGPAMTRENPPPSGFVGLGDGRALFAASDPANGREPWVTDGTTEGTRVLDIVPGPGGSSVTNALGNFTALGDSRALFAADNGISGREPWVTDGTPEGTRLVRDIVPGPGGSFPYDFAALGDGRALFAAGDGAIGTEPWITDGTPEGTRLVLDIVPGPGSSPPESEFFPFRFAALGDGRALFAADDGANGGEPWITDGTPEGTRLVLDIVSGPGGSSPFGFTALGGGSAVFQADNGAAGSEPWVTDGTPGGTRQLLDIIPGTDGSFPSGFTALGDGRAVFAASDPASGREPWVTDGTTGGSRLALDIVSGPGSSDPADLVALGDGRALFAADDGTSGREPWVTDGTPEGTRMVLDILPGPAGSNPRFAALGDGRALFAADDGANGGEPWITDGTPEGTRLVLDIVPGPGGSGPSGFAPLGTGGPSGADPFA